MSPKGAMSSQSRVWMTSISKWSMSIAETAQVTLESSAQTVSPQIFRGSPLPSFERKQARKREDFSQAAVRLVRVATEKVNSCMSFPDTKEER